MVQETELLAGIPKSAVGGNIAQTGDNLGAIEGALPFKCLLHGARDGAGPGDEDQVRVSIFQLAGERGELGDVFLHQDGVVLRSLGSE